MSSLVQQLPNSISKSNETVVGAPATPEDTEYGETVPFRVGVYVEMSWFLSCFL
jgi:hypothetical protein